MNKKQIKALLMEMRSVENGESVDYLLGIIDEMEEEKIQKIVIQLGNHPEKIRQFLARKIEEGNRKTEEKYPINAMFTYGITGDCIHFHLPEDLHELLRQKGSFATMDQINLYLLDAIERIQNLRAQGDYRLQDKRSFYMISPILIRRELKFLESLDFQTRYYLRHQLQDETFREENPEAKFATKIFGTEKGVGTASLLWERTLTLEWQAKKEEKKQEFLKRGATLEEKAPEK